MADHTMLVRGACVSWSVCDSAVASGVGVISVPSFGLVKSTMQDVCS